MIKHEKSVGKTQEWLTPPEVIQVLGPFDLDPCSPVDRIWDTAAHHFTILDNGLVRPWWGRVFLNPPYDRRVIGKWLHIMAQHANGTALIFARTDTEAFQTYCFNRAVSGLFVDGRIGFYLPNGKLPKNQSGAPSVFVAYSEYDAERLESSGIRGRHISFSKFCYVTMKEGTWREIVARALAQLQGRGDLRAIYAIVKRNAPVKVGGNRFYQEKIRQTLQMHFARVAPGVYIKQKTIQQCQPETKPYLVS